MRLGFCNNSVGSVLERQGKYEEAEAMHWQTLRGYEKVLGQSTLIRSPASTTLAWCWRDMASIEGFGGKREYIVGNLPLRRAKLLESSRLVTR